MAKIFSILGIIYYAMMLILGYSSDINPMIMNFAGMFLFLMGCLVDAVQDINR